MKQLTWLALFLGMLVHALGLIVGCQSSDAPLSSVAHQAPERDASPALESKVLLDPAATTPALRGALIQPQVVAARALLEADGYSYVEHNSLVLIQQSIETPSAFTPAASGPIPPRDPSRADRIRTDTVTWLAFENPTHDMGNHTAVLYRTDGLTSGTVLIELNIAGEWPLVIRQGSVSDSGFVSADIGTNGWLACVLGGSGASAIRCALSNCGWAHCTAIGAGASLVGCTIGWLVDRASK